MTSIEQELLAALQELRTAVRQIGAGAPNIPLDGIFARLDELTARLPPTASRDLRHYLRQKSHEKACLWLERQAAGEAADHSA